MVSGVNKLLHSDAKQFSFLGILFFEGVLECSSCIYTYAHIWQCYGFLWSLLKFSITSYALIFWCISKNGRILFCSFQRHYDDDEKLCIFLFVVTSVTNIIVCMLVCLLIVPRTLVVVAADSRQQTTNRQTDKTVPRHLKSAIIIN